MATQDRIRLDVRSEVGRLRRVLMHAPGPEVDRMVPSMMEELLFDDILFERAAHEEHRLFRTVLEVLGVEVLEAGDLLRETFEVEAARQWLLRVLVEDMPAELRRRLVSAGPEELASILVHGLRHEAGEREQRLDIDELFEVLPLPNWCFQRDPQVVLGQGVLFSPMATPTRWREALLASTIFRFHPRLSGTPIILDPLQAVPGRPLYMGLRRPSFEGGDVLVLSEEIVAVGYSERTNRNGVRRLARAFREMSQGPRWLMMVDLPDRRAYMHLDTVFTPIDRHLCLVFAPVILPGSPETAPAYEIDLAEAEPTPRAAKDLLSALRRRGLDLEPLPCGGNDLLSQQREQWTDGANAFALAPGVITLYDRNVRTFEMLAARGFEVIDAKDVVDGRVQLDLDAPRRACIRLPSHEISRARGGPHCLTHPLSRD